MGMSDEEFMEYVKSKGIRGRDYAQPVLKKGVYVLPKKIIQEVLTQ